MPSLSLQIPTSLLELFKYLLGPYCFPVIIMYLWNDLAQILVGDMHKMFCDWHYLLAWRGAEAELHPCPLFQRLRAFIPWMNLGALQHFIKK